MTRSSFPIQELIDFVNKHLNKVSLELGDIDRQLSDGVYLILLLGLLEGFFIPLYALNMTPKTFEERVKNLNLAFNIMRDLDIDVRSTRPEDIANLDLKSTLRITYAIYTKYKYVEWINDACMRPKNVVFLSLFFSM